MRLLIHTGWQEACWNRDPLLQSARGGSPRNLGKWSKAVTVSTMSFAAATLIIVTLANKSLLWFCLLISRFCLYFTLFLLLFSLLQVGDVFLFGLVFLFGFFMVLIKQLFLVWAPDHFCFSFSIVPPGLSCHQHLFLTLLGGC